MDDTLTLQSARALSIALGERDPYTRFHCDRVTTLGHELGIACGLSGTRLSRIRAAATFHDIGKIGVPDAVLLKPSSLTPDEWTLMKAHSEKGERIFRATAVPEIEVLAPLIRHHHEAFDGTGYPDGLKGDQIPICCRLMLIVDAYDAMTTARPYSKARTHEQAMKILDSEQGTKIDPAVFGEFQRVIERSSARAH